MFINIMKDNIMFINRINELQALNDEYAKDGARFAVIYGRRRVGKTALISEFMKGKIGVYHYATTSPNSANELGRSLAAALNIPLSHKLKFENFTEVFELLIECMPKENANDTPQKLIIAIDEFQNLAIADRNFISEFQRIFDTIIAKSNVMLIICGSVISMMHSLALDYQAPLYGRRTVNFHIKPLKFKHIKEFLPSLSKLDQILIYTSFGTIPKYLQSYEENKDFVLNLKNNILDKNSYLYSEGQFLLNSEITEPASYFSILESISKGNTKIGSIASSLGVSSTYLTRYLAKLVQLDLVEKEIPITEQNPLKSKFGRYRIVDKYLNFWFYYVYKNYSLLEISNQEAVLNEIKLNFYDKFVSFAFEDVVKEMILDNPKELIGFIPTKVGRWWDNKNEIDLVALSEKNICFIECKWQNNAHTQKVLSHLIEKSKNLINDKIPSYKVFTKEWFLAT
ncbi:ATP-binding protein [Campylobacter fetus]|nr:ATP-binding protein [Campylobacter fetus]